MTRIWNHKFSFKIILGLYLFSGIVFSCFSDEWYTGPEVSGYTQYQSYGDMSNWYTFASGYSYVLVVRANANANGELVLGTSSTDPCGGYRVTGAGDHIYHFSAGNYYFWGDSADYQIFRISNTSIVSPSITSAATVNLVPGTNLDYTITATGTAPITYSATNLSAGLTYDSVNHKVTGSSLAIGVYTFTAGASNSGGSDSKNVTVTVGTAPLLGADTTVTVNQGGTLSYTFSTTGSSPTYSLSNINPAGTQLEIYDTNKVRISGETAYTDLNDKSISFTINATNALGTDTQNIIVKYRGRVELKLYNSADPNNIDTDGINPQGFSLTTGSAGTAAFSLTNQDLLKVYTDQALTTEFNFQAVTMPGSSLPGILYLKALAPLSNATVTLTRTNLFTVTNTATFSVTMATPEVDGRIVGAANFVPDNNETDPANLVSSNGAVIELAMTREAIEAGNLELTLTGGTYSSSYKLFYDSACTQPVEGTLSGTIVANPTGVAARLCGGSLFIKPLAPVENGVARLTYTNNSGYTSTDEVHFRIVMNGVDITGYKDLAGNQLVPDADEENTEIYQVSGPFRIDLSKGDFGTGTVTLKLNNGSPVPAKFYTNQALTTELSSMSVDIENPAGDLAPLVTNGSMSLYVKPLVPVSSLNIELEYSNGINDIDKLAVKVNMTGIGITGYKDLAGNQLVPDADEENTEIYQVNGAFKIDLTKGDLGAGTVTLKLNNGSPVPAKFYTNQALTTELSSMSVDIENPAGDLAPLVTNGSMSLYVKPLVPVSSLNVELEYSYGINDVDKLALKVNMTGIGITGYKTLTATEPVVDSEEANPKKYIVNNPFKINLSKGDLLAGTLSLSVSAEGASGTVAKIYTDIALTSELSSMSVDIENPSGDLAALASGSKTLYVVPLVSTNSLNIRLEHVYTDTTSDELKIGIPVDKVNITGYKGSTPIPEEEEYPSDLSIPVYDAASVAAGTVPGYVKIELTRGAVLSGKIAFSIDNDTGKGKAVEVYLDSALTKPLRNREVEVATPDGDLKPLGLGEDGKMFLYIKPIAEASKVTARIIYNNDSSNMDEFSFRICSECPCTGCAPGDDTHSLGSVNSKFSLGSNSYGKPAGSIYLTAEELTMGVAGPDALQIVPFQGTTIAYTYDPNDSSIVQEININTGVNTVKIAFTTTIYGSTKYYTSNTISYCHSGETTPYRTVTITNNHTPTDEGGGNYSFVVNNLNISNALTLSSGTVTRTVQYEKTDANTWKLTRNGTINEYKQSIVDSGAGTKTETFYIGSIANPVFKETNVYKIYPWGDSLIQNIGAETTTYEYYDNSTSDGMKLGNLKKITYPKGDTVEYTYGANGNLLETLTTKGGHIYKSTREVFSIAKINDGAATTFAIDPTTGTFDYGTLQSTDTLTLLGTKEINKEYCDDTLTSHSESINYYVYSAGVDQHTVYEDATTTHTTTTEYYSDTQDTTRYGRVKKVVNSDGTIALYDYTRSGGQETVTSYSGEPNTGGTAVVNGSKNVSVYNENGTLMSSASYAVVASVETQTASETTNTLDDFGRVTQSTYMDGSTVSRGYGCCGVDWEIDRNGVRTDYMYDSTTKRLTSSERNGITTLYTYDQAGNTLTTTVKGRNDTELTTTNVYNEYGELTSSADPMNYTTTYTNHGDTVTYPNGTTSITNYTNGVVSGTSGTAVHAVTYTSGPNWQKVMPADITTYTDLLGRQYKTVYADNTYTETFYNFKGQAVKQVSPAGRITLTEYDVFGRVYRSAVDIDQDGVINNNDEITQYTYAYGTHSSKTVFATTVTRIVNSNSKVLSVNETTLDGMESWTTVNGLVTHSLTERQATAGQLKTTVEYPDGSKTVTTTDYGLTTKVESFQLDGATAGNVVEYVYDEFDRLSTVTEKYGTTTINEVVYSSYNSNGQPYTVTTNGKVTSYHYNNMGQRTSMTLPGSRTVTYTYKDTGELATVDGAETYKQAYDYDSQGRMSTLTTYKDASTPQTTTWGYNNRGFMTSKTYADSNATTYTYNNDGQLATRVWARGISTGYSYDNAGRQTGVDYSDSTPDIGYTYDWMGNVATVTDAEGTRTFTYDYNTTGHPGLASVTVPGIVNHNISYTYDGYGRRTAMSLNNNSTPVLTSSYGYNATSGRLATAGDGTYTAHYTWQDGTGLLTQNQIKDGSNNVITTHSRTYDTRTNNYHLLTTSNTTGATTRTYTYEYNTKDQRTKLTLADGTYWEYSYDDKGQVTNGTKKDASGNLIAGQYFGYSYDGIGNRIYSEEKLAALKLLYTTNSVNQYTQIAIPGVVPVLGEADADTTVQAVRTDSSSLPVNQQKTVPTRSGKYFSGVLTGIDNTSSAQTIPFDVYAIKDETSTQQVQKASSSYTVPKTPQTLTYDTDGNMTSDGEWTYTWNGENRMIVAEKSDKKLEFSYDFMGRRFSKKVYTGSTGNWTLASEQKFVYDGFKQIAEFDGMNSDALVRSYTWQPVELDVPLWVKDSSMYYYYIVDGNKNVRTMVDVSGNEVAQYDYNPFGKIVASSGAYKNTNPYKFSSEYYDEESGLIYYNYRYYYPEAGRWLSRDPIGENGGTNLYVIASNNTINYWDNFGLEWKKEDYFLPNEEGHHVYVYVPDKVKEKDKTTISKSGEKYDPQKQCCVDGKPVDKVVIYVINRGTKPSHSKKLVEKAKKRLGNAEARKFLKTVPLSGGHIDLYLPNVGMVGYYGDARKKGLFSVQGYFNQYYKEWTNPILGRPQYTRGPYSEGDKELSTICVLRICPDKYKKMIAKYKAMRKAPGNFTVGKTCADRASEILYAGGVNILPVSDGIIPVRSPWGIIEQLRNRGMECFTAYTELDANGNFRILNKRIPK